jgi:uncharacterized protein (TIGR04255 family)
MHRKYLNPPIVEALCEFGFEPGQPWDGTIPGLFYNEIKEKFPKKRQQAVLQVGIQISGQNPSSIPSPALFSPAPESFSRLQLVSEDERTLIQIAPDVLAVNKLKPYSSWNELKPLIFYAIQKYEKVAHPKAIRRIGLRYINRIQIPLREVDIEYYLRAFFPDVPEPLPQRINVWMQRTEIPFDSDGMLIVQTGSVRQEGVQEVVFLLDLDFVTVGEPFSIDVAANKVEMAHNNIAEAFEACITDESRKLFKEDL